MKKLITLLLAFMLLFSMSLFTACNPEQPTSSVTLVGLQNGTYVTPSADYDYFVVPEPAASTKVSATAGKLSIAGSLQDLYGNGTGYPQAVLVAKKSVIESNGAKVKQLINSFTENVNWLNADTTTSQTIVNAVTSAFIDQETVPTFTAQNLNKTVIANCGISYSDAQTSKQKVLSYLSKVNQVGENAFGTPVDGFFYNGECTDQTGGTLSLYCPDGAPALSVARLIDDKTIVEGLDVKVVPATTIQTYVAGANPTADLCIMPVNAASKILGNANNYQMLGVVTNGNLFILKKENGQNITKQNASTVLNNKKIGVINLANVPGLTLKAILKDLGIQFA